ncbi:MAG: hypothetical protein KAS15_07545 [Nanoarchaeota archaeon]|nr:hypothetical protein [Nanoarchaeota archaeon]
MISIQKFFKEYDTFTNQDIADIVNKFLLFPDNATRIEQLHGSSEKLQELAEIIGEPAKKFVFLNYIASHPNFSPDNVWRNEENWEPKKKVFKELAREYKKLLEQYNGLLEKGIPDLIPHLYHEGGKTNNTSEKSIKLFSSISNRYKINPINNHLNIVENYITTKVMEHLPAEQLAGVANLIDHPEKLIEIGGFLAFNADGNNTNELYFYKGTEKNIFDEGLSFSSTLNLTWDYNKLFSQNNQLILYWHTHPITEDMSREDVEMIDDLATNFHANSKLDKLIIGLYTIPEKNFEFYTVTPKKE